MQINRYSGLRKLNIPEHRVYTLRLSKIKIHAVWFFVLRNDMNFVRQIGSNFSKFPALDFYIFYARFLYFGFLDFHIIFILGSLT